MPTRAEVIQALKSRDEFQNRDIAQVLDYLEQEASGSSSTRNAILGRRRIKDEVSNRDLTAIYNYLAELGTPAGTIRDFLNALAVRRDIVSRALVNHILDLIDAASFIPSPPEQGNLLHWFDFTDLSTLFQDAAGLIPAVLQSDPVGRVDNKGTDGTPLVQVADDDARWILDLAFAPLPSVDGDDPLGTTVVAATIAAGHAGDYTFALVMAPENTGLAEIAFGWPAAITTTGMGIRQIPSATWEALASDASVIAANTYSVDVYIATIGISRVAGSQEIFHSLDAGSVSRAEPHNAIANDSVLSIGASDSIGGFDFQGHVGEVLVYDNDQGGAGVTAIKSYINGKYGVVFA